MAEEMDMTFLGAIPMDPSVCALGDCGKTFVQDDSKAKESFDFIVKELLAIFGYEND
jgi:hypothetical protein